MKAKTTTDQIELALECINYGLATYFHAVEAKKPFKDINRNMLLQSFCIETAKHIGRTIISLWKIKEQKDVILVFMISILFSSTLNSVVDNRLKKKTYVNESTELEPSIYISAVAYGIQKLVSIIADKEYKKPLLDLIGMTIRLIDVKSISITKTISLNSNFWFHMCTLLGRL